MEKVKSNHSKKRVLTPARRQQNREAQRLWRERQKQKKVLESLTVDLGAASAIVPSGPVIDFGCLEGEPTIYELPISPADTDLLTIDGCSPASSNISIDFFGYLHDLTLPDLHANALSFLPTTIISALIHNAYSLSLPLDFITSCSPDLMSPYYNPNATPSSTLSELVTALSLDPSTPADLVPTLPQFLIPHHVSLDLLPIPKLRENAIMLGAIMPAVFNVTELKTDVYERRGLTVWGSREKARAGGLASEERVENWQPWDSGVWEAEEWFLKKWALATDGEEGKLGKQSRWYKSVREAREVEDHSTPVSC